MNYSNFQQFADHWNQSVGHNAISTTRRHTATAAIAIDITATTGPRV